MNVLCAVLLGAAAIAAWIVAAAAKSDPRRNLRFAAMLYAALAAAGLFAAVNDTQAAHLTLMVGLLVSALAPPLLLFAALGAVSRPLMSSWAAVALTFTCIAAVAAALTGLAVLALIPQTIAIAALLILGLRMPRKSGWRLCLAALALFAGALAIVAENQNAGAIFSLFSAAGLLGVSRSVVRTSYAAVE